MTKLYVANSCPVLINFYGSDFESEKQVATLKRKIGTLKRKIGTMKRIIGQELENRRKE